MAVRSLRPTAQFDCALSLADSATPYAVSPCQGRIKESARLLILSTKDSLRCDEYAIMSDNKVTGDKKRKNLAHRIACVHMNGSTSTLVNQSSHDVLTEGITRPLPHRQCRSGALRTLVCPPDAFQALHKSLRNKCESAAILWLLFR